MIETHGKALGNDIESCKSLLDAPLKADVLAEYRKEHRKELASSRTAWWRRSLLDDEDLLDLGSIESFPKTINEWKKL